MSRFHIFSTFRKSFRGIFVVAICTLLGFSSYSQEEAQDAKISPSIKLSYKITNGKKSIKVGVSRKEDRKFIPVENILVNLYYSEIKKHDPETGEGWVGNTSTNEDGECEFILTDKFNEITEGATEQTFIASIGSDPVYEDTEEEITLNEVFIRITSSVEDSLTNVTASLYRLKKGEEIPITDTEMKLFVKRTFGMLPFGEENLETDEEGAVSGFLPADLPGNQGKTITVVAQYVDEENEGIIEVSKDIAWNIPPRENVLNSRTLWATGVNAPWALVFVTTSLIALIWGTIFYLITFLFKIKRLS